MMMAGLYLLAAVWMARYAGGNLWQVNGILGVSALGVLYVTRDARNQFLLAVTYIAVLLVTFSVESAGARELFWGVSLARFSDVLFILMGLLVAVKICFRKDGDFFISTADILFFALSVLFSTTYSQLPVYAGPEVLLKGIVFYLAVKTLVARNRRRALFSVGSVLTALLLIAVRGVFI
jgi:UDP-GlcNAc:undecaprenyl-phosphate GlcNAc-1-phosphate transferase